MPGSKIIGLLLLLALVACGGQQEPSSSSASEQFQSLLASHWTTAKAEKIYFRNDPDTWRMEGTLSEHPGRPRPPPRL